MPVDLARRFASAQQRSPRTHLLSNGSYSVMLTAAGSGFSQWRDIAVTRWREDATCDPWGYYVYLRDVLADRTWSAGYQPSGAEADSYEAAFFEDRAEIRRSDGPIRTLMEVLVAADVDAEARRITLTNESAEAREVEVTSYAEVVLSQAAADSAHPAFSKMFVQTEFVGVSGALLATRRQREPGQQSLWMMHFCTVDGQVIGELEYETDRARFLGRGHTVRRAVSIRDGNALSNTAGTVLDPVAALRRRLRLGPGETAQITFWTGVAADRGAALDLVSKLSTAGAYERSRTLAAKQAEARLLELGVSIDAAQLYQDIASPVLYADGSVRAPPAILDKNTLGQSTLWALGISGDAPIVLLSIEDAAHADVITHLLQAHKYWQLKNLAVDLIVLNHGAVLGAATLQALGAAAPLQGSRGAVKLLDAKALPAAHIDFLKTAARVLMSADRGLRDQLGRREPVPVPLRQPPRLPPKRNTRGQPGVESLEFFNGLGGFDVAAREYSVVLQQDHWTPMPWSNVIANPQFGFLASADGCGSTWSLNAQQNQITPWCNDPVSDAPAEMIYIRDENSAALWSATPLPIRGSSEYKIRHGFGYSRFEHSCDGISSDLLQFVPLEDPIKISKLKIVNRSDQSRQLSVAYYLEWVLGNQNNRAAPFIVTEIEPRTRALFARNPWGADFQSQIAFMDMSGRQQSHTADRAEFIGRHGSLAEPAALLAMQPLSQRVGGGLDPCGAMQAVFSVAPGQSVEFALLLGEADSAPAAVALIERYRAADLDAVHNSVTDFWAKTLTAIQVLTPDRSMDILLNGWLLYQTLSSRVWGRTAFYQSSGAFGFRDQLQDVMALCVSAPGIAREHILRAAARQFIEGDVQHWWLPSSGAGIKTRVADDRIWLAFVIAHYLEVTADFALLSEQVPFLGGGPLPPAALESFSSPPSAAAASLFEHCVRALDSSLAVGAHGLPLFGTGDWNDGMNRVGVAGRGESVWMGWFLHATLLRFAAVAELRGAADKAQAWRQHTVALSQAIEGAWDGGWYRRGYYDDGTALGSAASDECKIDSIAQSWAVISGAANQERATRAMAAVNAQLVDRDNDLVKLFTPPFDHTAHDPGYIKAYPPGLRENGGQYTHAATWSVLAFAQLGDGDTAAELFSRLNPINHASNRAQVERYKVEPYVICADVYSVAPHIGRGGWTWYTGSAGWMYRTGVEGILGIRIRGQTLHVDPCIPRAWAGFEFEYAYGASRYRIAVKNPQGVNRGVSRVTLDGVELPATPCLFKLVDDGKTHLGEVTLGAAEGR